MTASPPTMTSPCGYPRGVADQPVDGRHELAFQMATDRLAAQVASLDELRARVGVVLSGAGIATGFLAGQALNTTHGFPAWAWVGTLSALGLIVVSALILLPRKWKGLTQNARKVLQDVQAVPNRTMPEYYTEVAEYAVKAAEANDRKLDNLYRWFSASLVLLVVDFVGWIIVLARN
jgi:hypothetical protein